MRNAPILAVALVGSLAVQPSTVADACDKDDEHERAAEDDDDDDDDGEEEED